MLESRGRFASFQVLIVTRITTFVSAGGRAVAERGWRWIGPGQELRNRRPDQVGLDTFSRPCWPDLSAAANDSTVGGGKESNQS
jgi:hypothetical protein